MSQHPNVHLPGGGPEDCVIEQPPEAAQDALARALDQPEAGRRDAVSSVVADWPTYLDAWAMLGDLARDDVEAYAAFRVAYHRGLDQLRKSGWRGSGYVRWEHESNRGFLRALAGLQRTAGAIGERDEEERCQQFLTQLDPDWPPADPT